MTLKPFLSLVVLFALPAQSLLAADLPADMNAYVNRRAACNYWPFEKAGKDKVRKAEIERHVRNLNCDTLAREEVILQARYRDDPAMLEAIADARDALPD